MIDPPFDNEIKCGCCFTDINTNERFYISREVMKRDLDNTKVDFK